MNYPAYPEYKESGVQWLGVVPGHWKVLPLRRLIKFVKTGNTPSGAEEYHFEEDGFNWYSPSDFSDIVYLEVSGRTLSKEGQAEVRIFPEMTVMLVGIGATIGKVGLATIASSCNQQINAIICNDWLQPIFATYYLKTMRDFILKCGKFTTMPIINQDETKNLILTSPPLPEQTAIADFLDRKTGRIDMLVAKKQRLIALLKEKHTALISRTVTRGLPEATAREFGLEPHTRFKDSGIEWLGEVPEDWDVIRLKYVAKMESGHTPSRSVPTNWIEEECVIPWVSLNDTKHLKEHDYISDTAVKISKEGMKNSSAHLLPAGAVVFTRDATIGLTAITTCAAAVSQHIIAWLPSAKISAVYLLLIFKAMTQYFDSLTFGSTLKTIGMPDVRRLVTPLPPSLSKPQS